MAHGFGLGAGGLLVAIVQGLWLIALFQGFGAALFAAVLAPRRTDPMLLRQPVLLARGALAVALAACVAWLVLESAALAGTSSAAVAFATVPVVLRDTDFGHLLAAQLVLCVAALALCRFGGGRRVRRGRAASAALASGLAVVVQAWHLHAAAMVAGISLLLVAEVLHVLAGAAWLGSLAPLALLVGTAPAQTGFAASRRYSPFGTACVAVLAITASAQGKLLIGSWHGLAATPYGWMALVKLALFAALVGCAWRNHFALTPPLARSDALPARRALMRSIALEAAFGVAIVLAAAILASLPPAMDMH